MPIREAAVPSNWKKIYKLNYNLLFQQLKLNGVLGITETMPFNKGIFAICGRNGVGKSTVLAALKDTLGIDLSKSDEKKLQGQNIELEIEVEKETFNLQNKDGQRFIDLNRDDMTIEIIDYGKLIKINNYLEQDNLGEYLAQFEEQIYSQEDLGYLSYLIGKDYESVHLTVIEDDDKIIPYFKVRCYGVEYDSLTMGTGEQFLFYTHWVINNFENSGAVILEEPEVFISVPSQINLMNFIAVKMKEKMLTVLVATHSPFILQNIDINHMLILSTDAHSVSTFKVNCEEDYLQELGMPLLKKGTLLFEDTLALEFFKALCKKLGYIYPKVYTLAKMDGHANISSVLTSPKIEGISHQIIGVYDGDMRGSPNVKFDKINWKYLFLPGNTNLEEEFKSFTRDLSKRNLIAEKLDIKTTDFSRILSHIEGKEKHDWFNELYRQTDTHISHLVKVFTKLWIESNQEEVEQFFEEINRL